VGSNREDQLSLNDLAKALTPLIPEDWQLEVSFVKDEVSITLYDPDGDRIEEWSDDLTTCELALWYVNYARKAEGLPPGRVPGLLYENENGVYEMA
jgi:hypothetical protein